MSSIFLVFHHFSIGDKEFVEFSERTYQAISQMCYVLRAG